MKNKRGSHVGIVLSFVIFVTFLLFIYSILSPSIKIERNKQNMLDYLKLILITNVSMQLGTTTIGVNESYSNDSDCLEIKFNGTGIDLVIKDKDNLPLTFDTILDAELRINWSKKDTFFKVHYAQEQFDDFSTTYSDCARPNYNLGEYFIGSIKVGEYVFIPKIIKLKDDYEIDYEAMKENFNIPSGTEFDFSFTYENGSIIGIAKKDISTDIYAEEIPVQYVDRQANVNYGFFHIRIW